jgi:hypothetical protein
MNGISAVIDALREVGFFIPDEVTDAKSLVIAIKAGGGVSGGRSEDDDDINDYQENTANGATMLSTTRAPATRDRFGRSVCTPLDRKTRAVTEYVLSLIPDGPALKKK